MFENPEIELVTKITALVKEKFGGNYKRAFDNYARDEKLDKVLGRDEILVLLSDADIGNTFTRGRWADGILEKLDQNGDGLVTFSELQKLI